MTYNLRYFPYKYFRFITTLLSRNPRRVLNVAMWHCGIVAFFGFA